jgi:rod shape-determining protein MreB
MGADLALDFGSVYTRIANTKGKVIVEEPTLVAYSNKSKVSNKFGSAARGAGTRSSGGLRLVSPVKGGQLADVSVAEAYLRHIVKGLGHSFLHRRRILATTSLGTTPVQLRAMTRALERAGARSVRFLEQPLASALGANVAIEAPLGTMVVDIGGEISNIAVIALGGVVVGTTVNCGGEIFDAALSEELLARADLLVERSLVREARLRLGTLDDVDPDFSLELHGRDKTSGVPRAVSLRQSDVAAVIERELAPLFHAATKVISNSPPDITNDLVTSGIVLSGGGSQVEGLAHRLALVTGVPVHVHDEPGRLAVLGAARCLSTFDELKEVLTAAPQR